MPTAAGKVRVSQPVRRVASKSKPSPISPDELADNLASKLTIKHSKGKGKARPSPEETRKTTMRTVNAASKNLSAVVEAGRKASKSQAADYATSARKGLQALRNLSPGEVDIERAASSVVGKLIALEMYDHALQFLCDMHPPLLGAIYHEEIASPIYPPPLHLLALPISDNELSDVLMSLTSTYLLHAIISHSYSTTDVPAFLAALTGSPTLLAWLPRLTCLPSSQHDSLVTRAYTALAKCASSVNASPHAAYQLRTHALLCLAHTRPSVIAPRTFWDQAIKFAAAFVSVPGDIEEREVVRQILQTFDSLVASAQGRPDSVEFMSGPGFMGFCEYWLGVARQTGHLKALDKIMTLMRGIGSPSAPQEQTVLEATTICAALAQALTLFEHWEDSTSDRALRIHDAAVAVKKAGSILVPGADGHVSEKVHRALERLRRRTTKTLETSDLSTEARDGARVVLEETVNVLNDVLCETNPMDLETLSSALDALFVLARTTLIVMNPDSYAKSFDLLARASTLAASGSADCVRCVSAAFYHLTGTLYQAGRVSHCIRFLNEACVLGARALEARSAKGAIDKGKHTEAWNTLHEQLYRRWEFLGVCQSKTGDRKLAYFAFVESIRAFPWDRSGFAALTRTSTPSDLFAASSSLTQLAGILDRTTYVATCDLLLPPMEISAKTWMEGVTVVSSGVDCTEGVQVWKSIVGALLERQAESLTSSRWKPGVRAAIQSLLDEALVVYAAGERPVRRARVLLKSLELAYHANPGAVSVNPSEVEREVHELLSSENAGYDVSLLQFRREYLASIHLWLALHAHRQGQVQRSSTVVSHAEEACKALKAILSTSPRQSMPRQSLPKTKSPPVIKRKPAARSAIGTRSGASKSKVPKAVKAAEPPVTPNPRKAFGDISNSQLITPLKAVAPAAKSSLVFEDFSKLLDLIQLSQQLVGLLGYILVKVQLLNIARRLAEQYLGPSSSEYVSASVDLAHEYGRLGRAQKAGTIYNHCLSTVGTGDIAAEVRVMFLLRYAESLAAAGSIMKASSIYCEALALAENLTVDAKASSTVQRVKLRAAVLERAAAASTTFAVVQYSRDDPTTSVNGLLQSLRLWNRAVDTVARLHPASTPNPAADSDNPFDMGDAKTAEPTGQTIPADQMTPRRTFQPRHSMDVMEWRIADGLLNTLFALAQAYLARGSPREAEYFIQQARDFAESLNAPAMISRALARNGETLLHLGRLEEGYNSLVQAAELVADVAGPDAADVHRLRGKYSQLSSNHKDAQQLYEEAITMLDELSKMFSAYDGVPAAARKSVGISPKSPKSLQGGETLAPTLLAAVLRQHISLLHGTGAEYKVLLERFAALPHSAETKAEESALMAKLTLDDVYSRFRADMFLSSLAESTITIPMGMSSGRTSVLSPATQDIVGTLTTAEKMFWSDLALISRRGNVPHVRDTAVSLALVRTLQTSLGKGGTDAALLAARLLDASTAITLHREMLEAIEHKFCDTVSFDDLRWPLMTPNGSPLLNPPNSRTRAALTTPFDDSDEELETGAEGSFLKMYWESLRKKYRADSFTAASMAGDADQRLPSHWTVVNISVTEDRNTMFIARQKANEQPLIFCLPLKGRRDNQEDEHLTFNDAIEELNEIIRLSDEGTRDAANVPKDDRAARSAWWADRAALDKRLQELLENIEFCWLGAFKTIFNESSCLSAEDTAAFRSRLDKVFANSRIFRDKKQRSGVRLDDALLQCFSTLPADCRDEELEDLVYFILDLYQFHGVPVAIAEVDIDEVVVDVRSAFEEHRAKLKGKSMPSADSHTFLVLDKNVQGIPWESLPALRGKSVSRIPSMEFLLDRIQYARLSERARSGAPDEVESPVDRAVVDPRKTYFILNPSGDLKGTETRFAGWLRGMKSAGWDGIVGRPPSEQQFTDALSRNDLVVYFGHGGAEQYVRSHRIRHLQRCAATMLWGCSSGLLKEMGDFDRIGTPYNYMLAGCPTLVANLWDVTDRDIDKFSQSVFDDLHLTAGDVKRWHAGSAAGKRCSVVRAVARARENCKLKYLTGAAPVVYGIPFYL